MVHQHFTLADNLTVLDNIMVGTESLWKLASGGAWPAASWSSWASASAWAWIPTRASARCRWARSSALKS